MRKARSLAIVLLVLVTGLMGYVRFAPGDAARWQVRPAEVVPQSAGWRNWVLYAPGQTGAVQPMPGGAYAAAFFPDLAAEDLLSRLDAIALATPRTRRIAGAVSEGLITWQTRSAVWGFPDYTTAEVEPHKGNATILDQGNGSMLYIVARQRFGRADFGVNAARLTGWLQALKSETGANPQ